LTVACWLLVLACAAAAPAAGVKEAQTSCSKAHESEVMVHSFAAKVEEYVDEQKGQKH
jgi:hypothetical protein